SLDPPGVNTRLRFKNPKIDQGGAIQRARHTRCKSSLQKLQGTSRRSRYEEGLVACPFVPCPARHSQIGARRGRRGGRARQTREGAPLLRQDDQPDELD